MVVLVLQLNPGGFYLKNVWKATDDALDLGNNSLIRLDYTHPDEVLCELDILSKNVVTFQSRQVWH